MATPQIPPRPLRSKPSSEQKQASETKGHFPPIPPRPVARFADSHDPSSRDSFAPSPLNDPPFLPRAGSGAGPYGSQAEDASSSNISLPARPPSVTLPSIGQEGSEYADLVNMEQEQPLSKTMSGASETATSHVGSDLPLHAPKPSLSQSDQRARIQTVTRTDSDRAASAGLGRRRSIQTDDLPRGLKSKSSTSLRSPSVASTERPGSAQAEELGIPEIGVQVPMYPNAGDVQAPSPALQGSFQAPATAALHGDKPRHHGRTRSGREVFHGPPGSYGMHGHGVSSTDKFEKAWYDKHPEALAQEGQYSPALNNIRGDYVLSSEDLNKLVQGTARRGAGFGKLGVITVSCLYSLLLGTSATVVGLPDEQIGYMASEEYASRMASRPTSSYASKMHGNNSQTHVESPLRKTSFPAGTMDKPQLGGAQGISDLTQSTGSESDADIIHIDAPDRRFNRVTGEGVGSHAIDLGPKGGNTEHEGGYIDEQGYGVPILASDELRPGSEWQKPAVSPLPEDRRASMHDTITRFGSRPESAAGSRPTSRPASRPGSVHLHHGLSRYISHEEHELHTPLDDVEEYEPLFEDEEMSSSKPLTQADRLKHRPDMRKRFPSQDIWEDTPNSLQLQAEVTSPPPVEQAPPRTQKLETFESPAVEAARKGEVSEHEKAKLVPREERLEKSNFKPHLRGEMQRPSSVHRFPSQDIWEDSPDSSRLQATIGGELEGDAGLAAGAVVQTSARVSGFSREGATSGPSVQPRLGATASPEQAPGSTSDVAQLATATQASGKPSESLQQGEQVPDSAASQASQEGADIGTSALASDISDAPGSGPGPAQTIPSIPPRPSKHAGTAHGHGAHPQIPPRPHRQHDPHQHHPASPQEHSHLSEVYTAPSEEAVATQTPSIPSHDRKSSPTEAKKPPTIPQRPKPSTSSRTGSFKALSPEEVSAAAASREAFSPPLTAGLQGSSRDTLLDPSTTGDSKTGAQPAQVISGSGSTTSPPPLSKPSDLSHTGIAQSTSNLTDDVNKDALSRDATSSRPVTKVKPAVPARPGGSKIAALQAGFMSDLNNRLKLGPQGPQKAAEAAEEEKVEEKAPLADARKARARGPARRKPAASPGPGASSGTDDSTGAHAGAGMGPNSLDQTPVHPPSTTFQSICLWQVPSTGVFDPVHANFIHKESPVPETKKSSSLDGVSEDIGSMPLPKLAGDPTAETAPANTAMESTTQTGEMDVDVKSPTGDAVKQTSIEDGDTQMVQGVEVPQDEIEASSAEVGASDET